MNLGHKRSLRGEAGVTLMELLIVVAIIGMIAVILTIAVAKTIRRQRVETAAQEIRGDLQAVYTRAMRTQRSVFVRINVDDVDDRKIEIMSDPDGVDILTSFKVPDDVSLSTADVDGVECSWQLNGDGYPALECDFLGRTKSYNSGSASWEQVTSKQTLVVTHKDMVNEVLFPKIKYTITIFPLWNSTATKARW